MRLAPVPLAFRQNIALAIHNAGESSRVTHAAPVAVAACRYFAGLLLGALDTHSIHKLIVIGLIAHTCVEATVRFAVELGYELTVVKDATASYSDEHMHAALDVNIPNYASAVVTTNEVIDSISSLETLGASAKY